MYGIEIGAVLWKTFVSPLFATLLITTRTTEIQLYLIKYWREFAFRPVNSNFLLYPLLYSDKLVPSYITRELKQVIQNRILVIVFVFTYKPFKECVIVFCFHIESLQGMRFDFSHIQQHQHWKQLLWRKRPHSWIIRGAEAWAQYISCN